jgi:UDP-N-acetylglucosamine acyltransferase
MTQAHIPHDSNVGNNVTIANSTHIAGHCIIQDDVTLGLSSVIHQFRVIGKGAMVGMGSVVTNHVSPYAMQYGSPAKNHGCNRIGMQRQGYSKEAVDCIEQILKEGLPAKYPELEKQLPPELSAVFQNWYDLVESFSN